MRRGILPRSIDNRGSSKNSLGDRSRRLSLLLLLAVSLGAGIYAAHGQTNSPMGQSAAPHRSPRCPSPANPGGLYFECVGHPLDFAGETLTEDWAGLRTELRRIGVVPTASYTAQFMGNPSGGQSRGFTYSGTLQAGMLWDLEKLLRVPGLSLNVGGAWSTGKNLSSEYVGNLFTVQSAHTAPGNGTNDLTLGELYLQQKLFSDALIIAAGRLAPQSTFATMPALNQYLNGGVNAVAGNLGINDLSFTSYPAGVEWGVQAIYNVAATVQFAAGVFNTNQHAAAGARSGIDFSLRSGNSGALAVAQLNYLHNHAADDEGLPGQYSFGGFYDSNKFVSLQNPRVKKSGNYNIYALFQQMIYRDGEPGSQKGLTVWSEAAIAPKSKVNTMPYFIGAGMIYHGGIPGRDDDSASLGVFYGSFSRYMSQTTAETVIEANYQVNLTRWLAITPDLQYIIRPSGSGAIGNALVLGAQLAVNF
jgi:porin